MSIQDRVTVYLREPPINGVGSKFELQARNILSYTITEDLYSLADTATVVLAVEEGLPGSIQPGYHIYCVATENEDSDGSLVFAGTVDAISQEYNKTAHTYTLHARDYSGFLVDEYCSSFKDYESGTAKQVYDDLIDNVSALKYKDLAPAISPILFKPTSTDRLLAYTFSSADPFKVSPGDTVAGKLQELAVRMGVDFFYLQSGEILFGDLDKYRVQERASGILTHAIQNTEAYPNSFIKSCFYTNDLSGRYSTIKIIGETQRGTSVVSNTYDNDLLWNKLYVANYNDSGDSLDNRGIEIREQQREAGFSLEYTVPGHTNRGQPWQVNREVVLRDDVIGVRGTFLINSRTMMYNPTSGTETVLNLGLIKNTTNDPAPPVTGNSWKPLG